eukprot:g8295.t1
MNCFFDVIEPDGSKYTYDFSGHDYDMTYNGVDYQIIMNLCNNVAKACYPSTCYETDLHNFNGKPCLPWNATANTGRIVFFTTQAGGPPDTAGTPYPANQCPSNYKPAIEYGCNQEACYGADGRSEHCTKACAVVSNSKPYAQLQYPNKTSEGLQFSWAVVPNSNDPRNPFSCMGGGGFSASAIIACDPKADITSLTIDSVSKISCGFNIRLRSKAACVPKPFVPIPANNNDIHPWEAPAANTAETILRDLKDRRSKYKVGLKTHIEEQDEVYNKDAEWQMWEEIIDLVTGKAYYHNVATGKTQWTMPHGLALAYEGQEQELLKDFVSTPGVTVADVEGTGDKTWEMIYDPKAEKDFVVYRNKNTKELTAERPDSLIDTELKAKEAKLDQAKKMLNETWDGKRLQKELSKLRNDHEDELVEYASTVQDERKRQREKMREKLRERQRQKANAKKQGETGNKNSSISKPPPPRTKDAYLDATTTDDLKKGNDSFASLLAM